jgi:hypothetical protein
LNVLQRKIFSVRAAVHLELWRLSSHRDEKTHHGADYNVDGDAQVRSTDIVSQVFGALRESQALLLSVPKYTGGEK